MKSVDCQKEVEEYVENNHLKKCTCSQSQNINHISNNLVKKCGNIKFPITWNSEASFNKKSKVETRRMKVDSGQKLQNGRSDSRNRGPLYTLKHYSNRCFHKNCWGDADNSTFPCSQEADTEGLIFFPFLFQPAASQDWTKNTEEDFKKWYSEQSISYNDKINPPKN